MIAAHLPILQVAVPLIAAPLSVFCRRGAMAWALTFVVSIAAFLISIALLGQVLDQGTLSYELGDWAAPWGIEYRVDAANAMVLLIISGIRSTVLVPKELALRTRS